MAVCVALALAQLVRSAVQVFQRNVSFYAVDTPLDYALWPPAKHMTNMQLTNA